MKKQLSFLIWAFCFCAGFAQNRSLQGVWQEYKREIVGDSTVSKFNVSGRDLHPNLCLTITDKDFMIGDPFGTELLDYATKSDTLILTGFNKKIYTRKFTFAQPKKKELVIAELSPDSNEIQKIHYFRKSHRYISKDEHVYIHKEKDSYPRFPGGADSLKKFYHTQYRKPAGIDELSYEPVVKIMLTFNQWGRIINAEIVGQPDRAVAEEAIRLIKLMPDWEMGDRIKKKALNTIYFTYYPIEIVFKSKM